MPNKIPYDEYGFFNLKSTNRNINVLYSIKMKIESKLRRLCHLVSMVCFKILWCKYENMNILCFSMKI